MHVSHLPIDEKVTKKTFHQSSRKLHVALSIGGSSSHCLSYPSALIQHCSCETVEKDGFPTSFQGFLFEPVIARSSEGFLPHRLSSRFEIVSIHMAPRLVGFGWLHDPRNQNGR